MGTVEELNIWKQALSNAYFGFTATIFRDQETRKAVSQIPISRMILESDPPYPTPDEHCPVNNPWSVREMLVQFQRSNVLPCPLFYKQQETLQFNCINSEIQIYILV